MNRRTQLFIIILTVVTVTSMVSHIIVRSLGIRYRYIGGQHHYGSRREPERTILHCSSLGYSALDWNRVSEKFGDPILSWAVPGSSPAEWEMNHRRSPEVMRTFVVVDVYDLNEYILCDFRADIVPLVETLRDLRRTGADWAFCKRLLGQYPECLFRKMFPTVGRSDGVMTGIRDRLKQMLHGQGSGESREAVAFGPEMSEIKERLTDWSLARLDRRMVLMHNACQNRHSFNGPKKMALQRLVQQAKNQGPVTIIVVPVSPTYQKEFLTAQVRGEFEGALTDVQQLCPVAKIVRLDHNADLQDDALFSDLVHMNVYGQRIASAAFLTENDTPRP